MKKRIPNYTLQEETDVLLTAVKIWGTEAQLGMVYEELGELITVLNQSRRGRVNTAAVAEEIADVRIMLRQLEIMLGLDSQCKRYRSIKLDRLRERMKGEGYDI